MLSLDAIGIQGTLKTVQSTAIRILRQRPNQDKESLPISKVWALRFLKRFKKRVTFQRDTVQELDRIACEDPIELSRWFSDLNGKYQRLNMQKEDVYNIDEIGFQMGIGKPEYVITKALPAIKVGKRRRKRSRKQISSSKHTN